MSLDRKRPLELRAKGEGGEPKGMCTIPTPGRAQGVRAINESGAFDLTLDSRKPGGRAFRKWLTSEVCPSILRYGC